MNLYKIAIRNISRNRRRSWLSASAVAIAACSIVFLFGLMEGMLNDMQSNLWTYMTGAVRIRHSDFNKYERLHPLHLAIPNYHSLIQSINSDPAVVAISPRINFSGRIPIGGIQSDEKVNIMGTGIDFTTETNYQNYEKTILKGHLPAMGSKEALVGKDLAIKIGADIGDRFTVLSQTASRGSKAYTFTIAGILTLPISGLENRMIQIPLDTAQQFLWLPDQVQEILVKVDPRIATPKTVANRLGKLLTSTIPLDVWNYKQVNGMASMMETASISYDIIAIIFFLLASTVIINTTIMVIFERIKEIGTLAAMGMTGKQLVQLFFLEALTICMAGVLVGIGLGTAITGYLGATGFTAMAKAMEDMDASIGLSSVIYPVLNFKSTVLVFFYALAVTAVATWWPSRRAAKITPVEALKYN